jgi:hypothetical protein
MGISVPVIFHTSLKLRETLILNNKTQLIISLQKKILLFLSAANYASWHILKRNVNSLCAKETECELGDNPEYPVLYPLLRIGVIETARHPETGKPVYCLGPDVMIQTPDKKVLKITAKDFSFTLMEKDAVESPSVTGKEASLALLKTLPSLKNIISHWANSDIEMNYIYDRFDKNHFKSVKDKAKPNIYSNSNRFYSAKYIKTQEGDLYLIPPIEDNIDAVNIALCYLRAITGKPIFIYNYNTETIITSEFNSILPFIICRALILCDPVILSGEIFFEKNITINNVTKNHVIELKRIFGGAAVREEHE